MVTEHRVERHPRAQQRRERALELLAEETPAPIRVDVVAGADDEVERLGGVRRQHLFQDAALLVAPGAPVAEDGEAQTIRDRSGTPDGAGLDERASAECRHRQ